MKFYAYKGTYPLGKEPLGTFDKLMFEYKSIKRAINHCRKCLGSSFSLYSYYNFFNNDTFTLIRQEG